MGKKHKGKPAHAPVPVIERAPPLERAREQALAGKLDAALRFARQATAAAPDDPAAWRTLAQVAIRRGEAGPALDALAGLARLAPADAALAPLRLRALALAGDHRAVRALLADDPGLLDAEPWAAAYMAPTGAPAAGTLEAWHAALAGALASGDLAAWTSCYDGLAAAERPWAWRAALAWAAEQAFVAPASLAGPLDAILGWLHGRAEDAPADARRLGERALAAIAALQAGSRREWAAAQAALEPAPAADARRQRLLLALAAGRADLAGPAWRDWLAAQAEAVRARGQAADAALLRYGLKAFVAWLNQTRPDPARLDPVAIARPAVEALPDDPEAHHLGVELAVALERYDLVKVWAVRWHALAPDDADALTHHVQAIGGLDPAAGLAVLVPRLRPPASLVPAELGEWGLAFDLIRFAAADLEDEPGRAVKVFAAWRPLLDAGRDARVRAALAVRLLCLTTACGLFADAPRLTAFLDLLEPHLPPLTEIAAAPLAKDVVADVVAQLEHVAAHAALVAEERPSPAASGVARRLDAWLARLGQGTRKLVKARKALKPFL